MDSSSVSISNGWRIRASYGADIVLIIIVRGPPARSHSEAKKAAARFASCGSASHPAIIIGKDSRKADAVLAPN